MPSDKRCTKTSEEKTGASYHAYKRMSSVVGVRGEDTRGPKSKSPLENEGSLLGRAPLGSDG